MTRRSVCSILTIVVAASSLLAGSAAQAQIGRSRASSSGPDYWVGLSLGYVDGVTMSDNASGSQWQMGSSTQLRATLEKKLEGGANVGIAAGFSTAPLTYTPAGFDPNCAGNCQANTDVTQYMVFVNGGSGRGVGFHGLFNLEGGVTRFSNFRLQNGGGALPPTDGKYDVTFGFGAGFGYSVSQSAEVYAAESTDFVLHQQLTTQTTSAPRMFIFRAGLRIGF